MSDTKFTPGPWEDVGPNESGERCIYGADDTAVAVTIPSGNPDLNEDRSIANANLIAAAPRMYEALQEAIAELDIALGDAGHPEHEIARRIYPKIQVLAAARGETDAT